MINRVLKGLNSSGRLSIPSNFLRFVGIKKCAQVALCSYEKVIAIKPLDQINDCKVLAIVKVDSKGRIVYPQYLRGQEKEDSIFELYIYNNELIIESTSI